MTMRRYLIILLVVLIPSLTPCGFVSTGPSAPAPSEQILITPVAGNEFNKFFPSDSGEFDVVFTQEKAGFAQAVLNENGEEVATLSVSDTAASPSARNKFSGSKDEIAGYPAASSGSKGTAILVGDRFQIQIRSKQDTFTAENREAWLAQFDLSGLANLNQ